CSFCVVPYTLCAEYSRPVADIAAELERLVARGVREVTLLGQNVNAYHGQDENGQPCSLAGLLRHLGKLPGIERLRYTTSHTNDMTEELIAVHRDEAKVMPYLHLPFQAGSDRILEAMNRKHTRKDYVHCVEKLRRACPDMALSTDIIVGFPGETQDDFEQTMSLVEEIVFAQAYSFKYSPRPGTPAASLPDQVPDDVKSQRLLRLQKVLSAQQLAFNRSCVGRVLPVLFERSGRRPGHIVGRSPYLQLVNVAAPETLLGGIYGVEIQDAGGNSLNGVMVDHA
ncbi:MAG: MiaB/RimO family radical SAM methylthiotransferase, partial [Alphaproteobacteria bacterium]|nr:MiaB/RimO family radical SAM methylthiotransferase [Alphaproteobacteria bacterium]